MAPFRTCVKDAVCANGGAAPPKPPRLLFAPRRLSFKNILHHQQDLLRAHNCFPCSNTIVQAVYLQTGELRPPQPRAFILAVQGHVKYHPASKNRTHMDPFRTRDKEVVFACAPPPQPPAFFLRRAGLLSRTSYHQHDLLHEHHCSRAFQTHHAGSPFANCGCVQLGWGGAAPHPNSPAFHFTPADLFSRTWYHQPELFQKSIMQADGGLHLALS